MGIVRLLLPNLILHVQAYHLCPPSSDDIKKSFQEQFGLVSLLGLSKIKKIFYYNNFAYFKLLIILIIVY